MANNVMTGARAKISVGEKVIGIFDSCQYGAALGNEGVFTLGRYAAHEVAITSYELVQVSCSGFRVIGSGFQEHLSAPTLEELIKLEGVDITVVDRKDSKTIAKIIECKAVNWGEAQQAKATTKFSITYLGLILSTPDEPNAEPEQSELNDPSTLP